MEKFWMVYRIGGAGARFMHPTYESAMAEAGRLAGISPGDSFVVLEALTVARAEKPVVNFEWLSLHLPPPFGLSPFSPFGLCRS